MTKSSTLLRRIRWFSNADMERIHQASLDILWERGMQIKHQKMREMLADAGAKIDTAHDMVRFPPELVQRCLDSVPPKFVLGGRQPDRDITISLNSGPFTRSLNGTKAYVDIEQRAYRMGNVDDLKEWTRLLDGLPNIHICCGFNLDDVQREQRDVLLVKTMLENTTKPAMISGDAPDQLKAAIEMATAIRGSAMALKERPLFSILTSATSPAVILDYCIDNILLCGEYGIPVELNATPLMGGTCPVTIAGGILQTNLEILSLVVISQLAHPGTPVLYRQIPLAMDMATGSAVAGSMECAMAYAAPVQLAREQYGMNVSAYGFVTDAVTPDGQSQIERAMMTVMSAFSGVSILSGAGNIDKGNVLDPVQLVIDDQITELALRGLKGFAVNEDTLAVDVIKNAGPGKEFLSETHTLQYFQSEHLRSGLLNRLDRSQWEAQGGKNLSAAAQAYAAKLVRQRSIQPLPADVQQEIDQIWKTFAQA